ncbi:MAG: hypothetical protein FWD79_02205 [Desulfobulbus sp.]|nr:hypothetical protein [Desulfobulbus sp.]
MASPAQLKTAGSFLLITFVAVLIVIFMPIFPGLTEGKKVTGLDFIDNFFNQLAKSSAYYIPDQIKKAEKYNGQQFSFTMKTKSADEAAATVKLLATDHITAAVEGEKVKVNGDLGALLTVVLKDADLLYKNDDKALAAKYGVDGQRTIYTWYQLLGAMVKEMKDKPDQAVQAQAKFIQGCMSKAIEPAYNFYQVEAKPVKEEMMLLIAALAFYVIYTVWYGFGLMYLFEGLGIKIDH